MFGVRSSMFGEDCAFFELRTSNLRKDMIGRGRHIRPGAVLGELGRFGD